jgi:hypothetical protein
METTMTKTEIDRMSYGQLARELERTGVELTLAVPPLTTPPSGPTDPQPEEERVSTVRGAEAAALLKQRGARLVAIDGEPV